MLRPAGAGAGGAAAAAGVRAVAPMGVGGGVAESSRSGAGGVATWGLARVARQRVRVRVSGRDLVGWAGNMSGLE